MSDNDNNQSNKHVKSVSSGGESVILDHEARKADERASQNDNLTNIYNRRVRPYFLGGLIGRLPGW